jgi:hypothetical protein
MQYPNLTPSEPQANPFRIRPALRRALPWLALFISLFIALYACAPSATKKGAIDPDERREYIENYGASATWDVRKAFVAGKIVPGMTKDLVVFIVGNPDRTAVEHFGVSWGGSSDSLIDQSDTQDSIWEYTHGKNGGVRFGLRFQGDTLRVIQGDVP